MLVFCGISSGCGGRKTSLFWEPEELLSGEAGRISLLPVDEISSLGASQLSMRVLLEGFAGLKLSSQDSAYSQLESILIPEGRIRNKYIK